MYLGNIRRHRTFLVRTFFVRSFDRSFSLRDGKKVQKARPIVYRRNYFPGFFRVSFCLFPPSVKEEEYRQCLPARTFKKLKSSRDMSVDNTVQVSPSLLDTQKWKPVPQKAYSSVDFFDSRRSSEFLAMGNAESIGTLRVSG